MQINTITRVEVAAACAWHLNENLRMTQIHTTAANNPGIKAEMPASARFCATALKNLRAQRFKLRSVCEHVFQLSVCL